MEEFPGTNSSLKGTSSEDLTGMVFSNVHEHCITCFSIRDCGHSRKCSIILCPNDCNARFHECKTEDHVLYICPKSKVPCPNSAYGCPLRILRKYISSHLQLCPASIVHCKVERNRKTINKLAAQKIKDPDHGTPIFKDLDCSALDLCLALKDQMLINDSYKVSKGVLQRRTNRLSKYHPILPLISGHVSFKDTRVQRLKNKKDHEESTSSENEDDEEEMETPAVSSECVKCRLDPGSQHLHTLGSTAAKSTRRLIKKKSIEKCVYSNVNHNLLVDICLDFLSQSYPKRRDHYTILCDNVVRRQEFAWHYANLHADVVCSLDNWLIARCPMNAQGCQYYYTRLVPKVPFGAKIIYSLNGEGFQVNNVGEDNFKNSSNFDWSEKLPADLWIQICLLLTSQSLNAVSISCRKLRSICKLVLPYKGMVETLWSKQDAQTSDGSEHKPNSGKWVQRKKRWSFSKHFDHIDRWTLTDVGPYCSHIKQCPFYNPVRYSEPVPVMKIMTYRDLTTKVMQS